MPIIQDPRMNTGNEKQYGIVYVSTSEAQNQDYEPGHYFYRKVDGPNENRNSRYFPFGYPVKIVGWTGGNLEELVGEYGDQYCNLHGDRIAVIERLDNEEEYENHPMAVFMYRMVSHGTDSKGRGLRKIEFERHYRYVGNFDDIGGLIQVEE